MEKIRPETTWEKIKSIANKVGNHTLSFIEDTAQKIAVTVTVAFISNLNMHSFNHKYDLQIVFMPDASFTPIYMYATMQYYLRNILK